MSCAEKGFAIKHTCWGRKKGVNFPKSPKIWETKAKAVSSLTHSHTPVTVAARPRLDTRPNSRKDSTQYPCQQQTANNGNRSLASRKTEGKLDSWARRAAAVSAWHIADFTWQKQQKKKNRQRNYWTKWRLSHFMTSLQCPFSSFSRTSSSPSIIAITEMCSNLKPYIWKSKQRRKNNW